MASYQTWNAAIAAYFTAGPAKGTPIFLSLDEEALEEIGARLPEKVIVREADDFLAAVHAQCMQARFDEVDLGRCYGETDGIPNGVRFLGAMVLAANRMQDDEGIDEANYFSRLRGVLSLPEVKGRPRGLPSGDEEQLWVAWNAYLQRDGFTPTARRGEGGQKYVHYPLSQAILRESDKQFLARLFIDRALPPHYDSAYLGFWLSRQGITRRHLAEGLNHTDRERVQEFYQAAHWLYAGGDWASWLSGVRDRAGQRSRALECGLYRDETLFDTTYRLFPRPPSRGQTGTLAVAPAAGGPPVELEPLRPGFYHPLWEQPPFADSPVEFPVHGDPLIQTMVFPRRDFWVLTRDPAGADDAYATWKPYPGPEDHLLVLCRRGPHVAEMDRLREAKLLEWREAAAVGDWVEFADCMVLSYDWGGFVSTEQCRELAEALTPHEAAGVTFVGGLRDPNQHAWLEGFPPALRVYGFETQFEVAVRSSKGELVWQGEVFRQRDKALATELAAGSYEVEVTWSGRRVSTRFFRTALWEEIGEHPHPEEVVNDSPIASAGLRLRGPYVLEPEEASNGR